ncbi:IclR family transcriptional regulator [Gordonia sp. CPCC 206044]|uniref:IclR family transcriptional regulator n=1 Tax=Gordonia sp. CPCC 206044 TaxID=3140793 RepID=UPI003AF3FB05
MSETTPIGTVTPGGTEAADRVADVLLLFARSDAPLGVSAIARSLSLSKAVVHRILRSLVARSLLQTVPDTSEYMLGPAAAALSARAFSQIDVRSLAAPILRRLRDETQETTTLSVMTGKERVYLDQFESPQEVKMVVEIGVRLPLHSGASSRAILAFLPGSFIDDAVRDRQAIDPEFVEDGYRHELDQIRERGYSISLDERGTGAASIAAPIFDAAGNVMGSISSSGPAFRYDFDSHQAHGALVVDAARAITERIRS